MNAAGKREARLDTFDPGAKEYNALADRLVADAIDVVFIGGDPGDIALILKALRARGSQAAVMGGDSLATSEFTGAAGDAANGTLLTFFTDWRQAPSAQDVSAALRTAGVEPQGYVLPAYAAVQLWAEARRTGGSADGEGLAATVAGATTPTVLGAIAFDGKGDAQIPGFAVYRWQDGLLVSETTP
ncbi:MAG: ABC transporter substrate-binding protein, partial [Rhizobiales bacterium]|nr:ABC transporter substrate-binding protein [Hyphomicrobiales bacterium]